MDPDALQAFDARRDLSTKPFRSACYAPFVSLEFDTRGNVFTCCGNGVYPVGDVTRHSLEEIWTGERIRAQRQALRADDFSYGCFVCKWAIAQRRPDTLVDLYEGFAVDGEAPAWPRSMAFALSNACNLQCVQCGGEFSSSIRAHREHLPALPAVYGDDFFAQLAPFLPHLDHTRFLGGEPFMAAENHRLWDLLARLGRPPTIDVITNATRLDERTRQVLERLPMAVTVSLDGASPEVFEAIRVGADHAEVMANVAWLRRYTQDHGTGFGINFCLMAQNWHELPEMLLLGEALGCWVSVIGVHDDGFSVQKLPLDALDEVVTTLERRDAALTPRLRHNREVWHREVTALRDALDARRSGVELSVYEPVRESAVTRVAIARRPARPTLPGPLSVDPHDAVTRWASDGRTLTVQVDAQDHVLRAESSDGSPFFALEPADLIGLEFTALLDRLRVDRGEHVWVVDEDTGADATDQTIGFRVVESREKVGTVIRMITVPAPDGGALTVLGADTSYTPTPR